MKKFFLLLTLVFLAACGDNEINQSQNKEEEIYPLEVVLQMPEKAEANESISLKAIVTYGNEKVEDANEVQFEIWKEGNKESNNMIEASHVGDGIYEISYSFSEEGIYYVQSHVTAKDQHNMPKKQITIGDTHNIDEEQNEHTQTNHHHGAVEMKLLTEQQWKANQETTLKVSIKKNENPISNARIRFEIWKDGSHDHQWIETNEIEEGIYEAAYTFEETGTYYIQIHVENDEGLHEHSTQTVEVS